MKILYHHRTLADGAEGIHIAEMVSAFRSLGHDVAVCGLAGPEGSAVHSGRVQRLKRMLPSAGYEVASVASNVPDALAVRRSLRATRPDFLYKRHARLDVGALQVARAAGIPSVLEVNCLFAGIQYHRYEPAAFSRVVSWFERRALTLADVVIAVSTPLAHDIERISGIRAVVLPNAADPERFDPARSDGAHIRARLGLDDAFTVGWVGVMRQWHGLELLLDAIARVPEVRLLIVGDGPARAAVERHASAIGVAGRTLITGWIPPDQMPELIAAMEIAVVASDGTGVASPMKLLEYMAMQRAVVAPRLQNIQDLVTDERDGLLFAPGSADDLAGVLRRLVQDEPLRVALGREARRKVQEVHNWRRNAEHVLALINGQISAPSRRMAWVQ